MSETLHHRVSLSLPTLERFCHLMGLSLRGGQSFVEALRATSRSGKWDARPVIDAVMGGESAASALKKSRNFPELLIGMVEVGEASGKLDETFLRLADYYRELIRSQRAFRQGIFRPVLQLIAAATILSLLFFALDHLQRTVTVVVAPDLFGLGLPPLGNMAVVMVVTVVILLTLGVILWRTSSGRVSSLLSGLLRRLPGVGTTWKRISTSRFAWTLGAAIDAGTDAVTAVRWAVRGSSDAGYKKVESQLVESLRNGESFEAALAATHRFPPELVQAIAVGESTGQVTECVQRLSLDYDEQNAIALRRMGQVSGMAVSLSVVLLLGFTVVSMYSQYLQMVSGALRANSQTLQQMREVVVAGPIQSREILGSGSLEMDSAVVDSTSQNSSNSDSERLDSEAAGDEDNELIQTRDRMVKDFVENNADFGKFKSIYSTLGRFNELTPNEFLDAIAGDPQSPEMPATRTDESEGSQQPAETVQPQ
ncbi:MAG: type II secretion system F family protein [Pirellulaceae bacterium]|jgi:type IV pilus assembly protein PilC|nr:type II secretion system F family protein [Pirellulaceae bacterium]